jgi:hypothetical protein
MKQTLVLITVALAFAIPAAASASASSPESPSHRSRCHQRHTCPSDHATYRWRGLLCVAPYSDKRNSTFKRRVVYAGRTYYCKR